MYPVALSLFGHYTGETKSENPVYIMEHYLEPVGLAKSMMCWLLSKPIVCDETSFSTENLYFKFKSKRLKKYSKRLMIFIFSILFFAGYQSDGAKRLPREPFANWCNFLIIFILNIISNQHLNNLFEVQLWLTHYICIILFCTEINEIILFLCRSIFSSHIDG